MKKLIWIGLIASLSLCGCARHYVVKFNNGNKIVVCGKPKHTGSSYFLKDAKGQVQRVPDGSIAEIAPVSMFKKEKTTFVPETLH